MVVSSQYGASGPGARREREGSEGCCGDHTEREGDGETHLTGEGPRLRVKGEGVVVGHAPLVEEMVPLLSLLTRARRSGRARRRGERQLVALGSGRAEDSYSARGDSARRSLGLGLGLD